jgi:homoserine dehydrogenase
MTARRQYKIGLLGCGTIGQDLLELVSRNRELIHERSGVDLSFTRILVRDLNKRRPGVDSSLLTTQTKRPTVDACPGVVSLTGANSLLKDS